MKREIVLCLPILLSLLNPLQCLAQEKKEKPEMSTIRVQGEANVSMKPDQAEIQISVVTQGAKADQVARQNAEKADRVIKQVRKELQPEAQISTINYSLTPNYEYPKEGGQPRIVGYTASNTIQVKTGELNKVGDVIDSAIAAGANNIQSLRFGLKDEAAAASEALKQAAGKAREKAQAIASALGLQIVRVVRAEEGGPVVVPVQERGMMAKAEMAAAPTPVEAGTVEVNATLTLTVEVR